MTYIAEVHGCSDALEHECDALTDTDAHRHHSIPAAGGMQTVCRGGRQPGAAGAERMADSDGIEKQIADFVPCACACVARVTRPISIVTRRDSTLSPASESFVEIRPGTDTARRSPARHAGWRRPPRRAATAPWYSPTL